MLPSFLAENLCLTILLTRKYPVFIWNLKYIFNWFYLVSLFYIWTCYKSFLYIPYKTPDPDPFLTSINYGISNKNCPFYSFNLEVSLKFLTRHSLVYFLYFSVRCLTLLYKRVIDRLILVNKTNVFLNSFVLSLLSFVL